MPQLMLNEQKQCTYMDYSRSMPDSKTLTQNPNDYPRVRNGGIPSLLPLYPSIISLRASAHWLKVMTTISYLLHSCVDLNTLWIA